MKANKELHQQTKPKNPKFFKVKQAMLNKTQLTQLQDELKSGRKGETQINLTIQESKRQKGKKSRNKQKRFDSGNREDAMSTGSLNGGWKVERSTSMNNSRGGDGIEANAFKVEQFKLRCSVETSFACEVLSEKNLVPDTVQESGCISSLVDPNSLRERIDKDVQSTYNNKKVSRNYLWKDEELKQEPMKHSSHQNSTIEESGTGTPDFLSKAVARLDWRENPLQTNGIETLQMTAEKLGKVTQTKSTLQANQTVKSRDRAYNSHHSSR